VIGRRRFLGLLAALPAAVACKPVTAAPGITKTLDASFTSIYLDGRVFWCEAGAPQTIQFSALDDAGSFASASRSSGLRADLLASVSTRGSLA
jgi:hypothetical protein